MSQPLRNTIWFASVGLVVLVAVWVNWLYLDRGFHPYQTWIEHPSVEDVIRLGLLLLAGLGIAISARPFSSRRVCSLLGFAFVATMTSYFLGNWIQSTASEQSSSQTISLQRKPNTSNIVLGYHWTVPQAGGPVAYGDGSVRHTTKEEFLAAPKAEPADFEPRFRSPLKSNPANAGGAEPRNAETGKNARDPIQQLRLAEERMKLSSFLKRLAVAHYSLVEHRVDGQPPLEPADFRTQAVLNEQELATLTDGTFVWYYGWNPFLKPKHTWAEIHRTQKQSWLALQAFSANLSLLLCGFIMLLRARQASRKKPVIPA